MSNATIDLETLQERIRLADVILLGKRIRQARLEAGYSHDRLGELADGLTRQHLIKLEKAQHRPRPAMLIRIATATGRDVEWFLAPEVAASSNPFPSSGHESRPARRAHRRPAALQDGNVK
jgi:transcriptional regulator with XRE-family HTH domain